MAAILEVEHLYKEYPGFLLKDVSFSVGEASIMGFLGRNGAGKTTTLKSLMNLIRRDAGSIRFFGLPLEEHETEIRQRVGFAGGAAEYYRRKPARELAAVTRTFYENWDEAEYHKYLRILNVNDEKTPEQMSDAARVKMDLVLALSHHAELLILDEPTGGLDPAARTDLTDAFRYLRKQGVSILFSSHITSDLENCADGITYIRNGEIIASEPVVDFITYRRVRGFGESLEKIMAHYEREGLSENPAE